MYEDVVGVADRLAGLIDTLDPDRCSGVQAQQLWAGLDRIERLAAAGKTLLARRLADTHAPDRAGTKTAAEELARRAGTTTGAALDALEVSKRLAELPQVDSAIRRGELSAAQATAVSSAAAADPAAQQRLLDLVSTVSPSELRDECARVRVAADPDPEETNRRLHKDRRLRRFTGADGFWTLIGKGTPQAGGAFNTALDPILDEVFQAARREGRQEPHDAYAFDALMLLAERASGRTSVALGQPTLPASPTPALPAGAASGQVSTAGPGRASEADTVEAAPPPEGAQGPRRIGERYLALMRVDVEALRRGGVAGDELCEIAGVGPVPVGVARELLGDAVLKLVITRGVDVCNVTHLGRGPTAAQRVALAWTSPGCTVEGCARTRIEYDHSKDWKTTRHTRLDELDPLCTYHHSLKTRLGWAMVPGYGNRALVPPDDPRHPRHQRPTTSSPPVGRGATRPPTPERPPQRRRRPVQQTLPALSGAPHARPDRQAMPQP